ncbi:MAG: hypothetical protein AB8B65_20420 [Kordia sp.]|uniref:hypothetical protein n=1 Tax=Kordia sp. TaxID=1965332 RepID=UPI0038582D60
MKKRQPKKLQISKVEIAKISTILSLKIVGGTDPISDGQFSAHASQCGNLMCY